MKNFVVYAKVELTKKPIWLDSFRLKYDKPHPYHVTLKPSCLIEEGNLPDIKNKLQVLFSNLKIPGGKISLKFNSLNIHRQVDGNVIMIDADKNETIDKIQKSILQTLNAYQNYRKEKYRSYAENFQPHITIGRELSPEICAQAEKELAQDYSCEGEIKEIVLVVVDNPVVEEANNPKNQTIYNL